MDFLQVLKEFSKVNPKGATLLFGAVACFAAVGAIGAFGIKLESQVSAVVLVLIVGILLMIVTNVVNNELMMGVVTWFALLMGVGWIFVFIGHKSIPKNQELACVAYFWIPCAITADEVQPPSSPQPPPPAKPVVPANPQVKRGDYQVFVQFAGQIVRDDVKTMMKSLGSNGWNVQGAEKGGERTGSATDYNEVRYSDAADAVAAQELAEMVQSTATNLRLSRSLTTKLTPRVKKGSLEVYISN